MWRCVPVTRAGALNIGLDGRARRALLSWAADNETRAVIDGVFKKLSGTCQSACRRRVDAPAPQPVACPWRCRECAGEEEAEIAALAAAAAAAKKKSGKPAAGGAAAAAAPAAAAGAAGAAAAAAAAPAAAHVDPTTVVVACVAAAPPRVLYPVQLLTGDGGGWCSYDALLSALRAAAAARDIRGPPELCRAPRDPAEAVLNCAFAPRARGEIH